MRSFRPRRDLLGFNASMDLPGYGSSWQDFLTGTVQSATGQTNTANTSTGGVIGGTVGSIVGSILGTNKPPVVTTSPTGQLVQTPAQAPIVTVAKASAISLPIILGAGVLIYFLMKGKK